MKKKLMALVLLCTMVAALTACGGKEKNNSANDAGENTTDAGESVEKKNATITYVMPEGFTEQSEGQWVAPDYPNDSSNIIVQQSKDDPYGVNYTEDQFKELITVAYDAQGYTVDEINVAEFTKGKLDDYDTLLIDVSYSLMGVTIQQLEYLIQINDITYVITYTTAPELDWYDAFRTSIDSVQIVYE